MIATMTAAPPHSPTALVADDEPLLRAELAALLAEAWPALTIVAQARNGREAVELFERHRPDICFLDVQMPGLSGIDAARLIGPRAQLVFVTAFDQYALKAFEHGVLDYLVKPVDPARLAGTVARLQQRLGSAAAGPATEALLQQLADHLQRRGLAPPTAAPGQAMDTAGGMSNVGSATSATASAASPAPAAPLRWIRATVGGVLRLIAVDDVDFLRSDEKYTLVGWRGDDGQPAEALISVPLKTLLAQLDAQRFVQVHRSVAVNLTSISHVTRGENETAQVHLKRRTEVLPVSRSYLHLFKQM